MDIKWNREYVDLQNVINISRGSKTRVLKYLQQFLDLIPQRMESLKVSLKINDRKATRQSLHQMSPQLQFFGIPDIVQPIRRLEHEYKTIAFDDLQSLVFEIIAKLENAVFEIRRIIEVYF